MTESKVGPCLASLAWGNNTGIQEGSDVHFIDSRTTTDLSKTIWDPVFADDKNSGKKETTIWGISRG